MTMLRYYFWMLVIVLACVTYTRLTYRVVRYFLTGTFVPW